MSHKLIVCVLLIAACGAVDAHAQQPNAAIAPNISPAHREFLSRVARRTLRDVALGRSEYAPSYVPKDLRLMPAQVIVRLRRGGYLLAEGVSQPELVTDATKHAALAAHASLESAGAEAELTPVLLRQVLIEIEAVGNPKPIGAEIDWTKPRALDPYVEPGIDGLLLVGPQAHHRFAPSEVFTSDLILADALSNVAQQILSDPSQVAKTRLFTFRADHWYEAYSGADIVSLHRGMIPIKEAEVTRRNLDAAIERIAHHIMYRQVPSGLFGYQYSPATDQYSDENNLVRQVGTAMSMAAYARWADADAARASADLAIRHHLQGLVDIPGETDAAFIATADKRNKLGVTALLALTLAHHPDDSAYADTREKLINGMLWLQRPSGMFITAFPPAEELSGQDYFPGEALLAMAEHHSLKPSQRVVEAFDRAINFYQSYFRGSPSPAFMPWQVQAFSKMARHSKRRDYVDFVFELTDWLAEKQLHRANCRWEDLWGGIAAYQPGRAGVATAAYLEGFTDALELARVVGDEAREKKYERVVRRAARFVMQLEVREEETYFMRSQQDALGAIRTTPTLNLLRIDHNQHALVALMKTRRVLYGDPR